METLVAASPAVSIRLDVLSEFSELGIRFEKDLSNAVTLANVLDSIRYGAPAWLPVPTRSGGGWLTLNVYPPFSLGGGNASKCPIAAIA